MSVNDIRNENDVNPIGTLEEKRPLGRTLDVKKGGIDIVLPPVTTPTQKTWVKGSPERRVMALGVPKYTGPERRVLAA